VFHSVGLPIGLGKCRRAATVVASSLAVLLWAAPAMAQGMALPGKFGVGATGAATYAIPIAVPPGTAGMLPSLSLTYNSQGGNGLVGMGWMLDGLPSIGRCPRTLAQDNARGTVKYDASDRFCLDGQRLVATSGTYGANGTEYRTEVESFSKIVSFGTAGTGPAWFEVKTKSGQIMQFGNTTDSRILAQGKTTARDWALNKVSDTKGNYFTVTYVNDTTNGQAYPTRIDYTGNASAGLTAYNSVRFVYDSTRPDVVPAYNAGSLRKTTVRLSKVQTYAGANMVADYRLTYAQGTATNRSQLTSVTLCDGTGATCLPATTFAWQSGPPLRRRLQRRRARRHPVGCGGPDVADLDGHARLVDGHRRRRLQRQWQLRRSERAARGLFAGGRRLQPRRAHRRVVVRARRRERTWCDNPVDEHQLRHIHRRCRAAGPRKPRHGRQSATHARRH
jgi:hypothetical protein